MASAEANSRVFDFNIGISGLKDSKIDQKRL